MRYSAALLHDKWVGYTSLFEREPRDLVCVVFCFPLNRQIILLIYFFCLDCLTARGTILQVQLILKNQIFVVPVLVSFRFYKLTVLILLLATSQGL